MLNDVVAQAYAHRCRGSVDGRHIARRSAVAEMQAAALTNPNYTAPTVLVLPDAAGPKKLRVILPGQTRAAGTVAGKTGTATGPAADTHFTAGQAVAIEIDGTDTWGNRLNATPTFTWVTDDAFDGNDPRNGSLVNGTTAFTHIFVTERTSDAGETTSPRTVTTATVTA